MNSNIVGATLTLQFDEGQSLRIGEVAALTGLTQRTIRYYEEVGLLPAPSRTQGDFRLYSPSDVERLQRVVRLRDLFGFSLAEIRQTLEAEDMLEHLRSEYRATEDAATRIEKLDQALVVTQSQMELIERKMRQMQELKEEISARRIRYLARRAELSTLLPKGKAQRAKLNERGEKRIGE